MDRRMMLLLAAVGALLLAAGTEPARAQDTAPAFVQVLPADGQVLVTWARVPDATGYAVLRRTPGEEFSAAKPVNAAVKGISVIDTGLTNDKPLLYSVQPIYADGSKGEPVEAVGTPHKAILGKFQFYDIATLYPGSATVSNNLLTIRGSGIDVWAGADGHTFLATPVAGDFTMTVKLLEKPTIENGEESPYGKVGVQAKSSIIPVDPYALVFASVERSPAFMYEGRPNPGGEGENWSGGTITLEDAKFPVWLRLKRVGTRFSASTSFDGATFDMVYDDQTIPNAPATMYVGIAATAHKDELYVNAKIDANSVTITTT